MSHRLQYGFEFEVISGLNEGQLRKKLKKIFPEFKTRKTDGYICCTPAMYRDSIILTEDCSIDATNKESSFFSKKFNKKYISHCWPGDKERELLCIEIVFPIVNERKAKDILHRMEKHFFKTDECRMNKSCGLHVNVSFVSRAIAKKINLPSLEISFDIDKWRKTFNRTRNQYCTKLINGVEIRKAYPRSNGCVNTFLKVLKDNVEYMHEKYRAINTTNFDEETGKGRIEFRVPGGPKAMNSKLMSKVIDEINAAMHESIKPYSLKITRRINKSLAA